MHENNIKFSSLSLGFTTTDTNNNQCIYKLSGHTITGNYKKLSRIIQKEKYFIAIMFRECTYIFTVNNFFVN